MRAAVTDKAPGPQGASLLLGMDMGLITELDKAGSGSDRRTEVRLSFLWALLNQPEVIAEALAAR